jgi:hypothetical protein
MKHTHPHTNQHMRPPVGQQAQHADQLYLLASAGTQAQIRNIGDLRTKVSAHSQRTPLPIMAACIKQPLLHSYSNTSGHGQL